MNPLKVGNHGVFEFWGLLPPQPHITILCSILVLISLVSLAKYSTV